MDLEQVASIMAAYKKPLCEFASSRERTASEVEGWMQDHNPVCAPKSTNGYNEMLLADLCAQFVSVAPNDLDSKIENAQRLP